MSKISKLPFVFAAASLVLFGWGCNPFQAAQDKINEKVAEGVLNQVTGGKVDIQKDGDQVTFTDNKTGASTAFGEDVKLPDDFPKDALMYPGAKVTGVTLSRTDGISGWVMLTTKDSAKTVADWYVKETKDKGWEEESSLTMNDAEIRSYTKGNAKLSMSATPDEEKGETTLVVTYEEKTEAAE